MLEYLVAGSVNVSVPASVWVILGVCRSDVHDRFLIGKEILTAMGMVVSGLGCRAAHMDPKNIVMLSEHQRVKAGGNGMSLPCVGLAMLAAVLLTAPVGKANR